MVRQTMKKVYGKGTCTSIFLRVPVVDGSSRRDTEQSKPFSGVEDTGRFAPIDAQPSGIPHKLQCVVAVKPLSQGRVIRKRVGVSATQEGEEQLDNAPGIASGGRTAPASQPVLPQ